MTQTTSGSTAKYTVWALDNGTARAVYYAGQNYTGFYAQSYYLAAMAAYIFEVTFASPQVLASLTSALFTHQTGTATVMIGPTTVMVTDFTANQLPLSINQCGFMASFTKLSLQTGVVSGVQATLLTALNLAGTFSGGGQSQSVDFTLHVTSITK